MRLSRIDLYPIKSLDGVSVTEVCITAGGTLESDRIYAMVDDAGAYVNGKLTGQVHLLRTTFADNYKEASFWVNGDNAKQDFDPPVNRNGQGQSGQSGFFSWFDIGNASRSHLEHHAKTRFAAHHAVVSLCSTVQGVFFDHWQHSADLAKLKSVFGID